MPALDLESLLAPLPGDAPCGANLEYDPAFQALEEAAAGKPERQYDRIYPAEPPDWPAVREFALFGETTGEADEFGLPIRYNWAAEYRGKAMVVSVQRRRTLFN